MLSSSILILFLAVHVEGLQAPRLVDLAGKQAHLALHGGEAALVEAPQFWVQRLEIWKNQVHAVLLMWDF